ncbi:hypothetical protein RRG08_031112 [Elysia crispata]|uniref:Uncharacterized protein n=1 Tax=Elysia crispata TaxID=231223 RepID=A0AAE0ZFF2_9GAST|nr:hypothetical protein RRG08_031112 [Elysia crispata]
MTARTKAGAGVREKDARCPRNRVRVHVDARLDYSLVVSSTHSNCSHQTGSRDAGLCVACWTPCMSGFPTNSVVFQNFFHPLFASRRFE